MIFLAQFNALNLKLLLYFLFFLFPIFISFMFLIIYIRMKMSLLDYRKINSVSVILY